MDARRCLIFALALVLLVAPSAFASADSQGNAVPLLFTVGTTSVSKESVIDVDSLVEEPSQGIMGVFDFPVWGPVSLGVMGSVWHQSQQKELRFPAGVERQFRFNALLSGGPSIRLRFENPSEWSLFAAAYGGVLVSYRESRWEDAQPAPARDLGFRNGLGFAFGITFPTIEVGRLNISAAALYEHTRFPEHGWSWSHFRDAVAVERISVGIDLSFSF